MRRNGELGIVVIAVLGALVLAPVASAKDGTVTALKGSTLTVTFPDGTRHTQPLRGHFEGTLPAPKAGADVRLELYQSTIAAVFGTGSVSCVDYGHGSTAGLLPWTYVFTLAQTYSGAPPSIVTFRKDGRVTLTWTVPGSLRLFTVCAPPNPGQLEASQTLTLTGRAGKRGLRRLVLRGGARDIPVAGGGTASFSVRLITRVDL